MRVSILLLALVLPATSYAKDVAFFPSGAGTPVLAGADVPAWSVRGFGNPTVVWNAEASEWAMYFEARFTQDAIGDATLGLDHDYSGCAVPNGNLIVWGVGRATSTDGFNWTVHTDTDGNPVPVFVPPGDGDPDINCQVAQPDVILDEDGSWHMWFKAADGPPTAPDVGVTGIGYATSTDGIDWSYGQLVLERSFFGFPKARRFRTASGTPTKWGVWFTEDNIEGGNIQGDLTEFPGDMRTPVINVEREPVYGNYFNAAPTCNATDASYPLQLLVGTQDLSGTGGTHRLFDSADGQRWIGGPPFATYPVAVPWNHWDSLGLLDGSQVVYFTIRNAGSGLNEVYIARIADELPDDPWDFVGADLDAICTVTAASDCADFEPGIDQPDEACCTEQPFFPLCDACDAFQPGVDEPSEACCADQPEFPLCDACDAFAPGVDDPDEACCLDNPEFPGCADVCEDGASAACCANDPTVDGCKAFLDCADDPDQLGCECEAGDEDTWAFCADGTGCHCSAEATPVFAWPLLGVLGVLGLRRRRR